MNPIDLLRPRRQILGMSAILLPYRNGAIDWDGFHAHLSRTWDAGLVPAVNMDTGYVNLLSIEERRQVLRETNQMADGRSFVAGAFVGDKPGDPFNLDAYRFATDDIHQAGGTPVIFQSFGLTALEGGALLEAYGRIADQCPEFIGFELGTMFAPFGRIYTLDEYAGLMAIPSCVGAKHSSLSRAQEWERLMLRDRVRPEFKVLTGNDLAIDMVMYGSDYLLGLSTFAPDLFAERDRLWAAGDAAFHELNDVLQYLGFFAFRTPVPAYKHSAAQFLKLRGWIASDETHPRAPRRPSTDVDVLSTMLEAMKMQG